MPNEQDDCASPGKLSNDLSTQDAGMAVAVWDWPIRLFHWSIVALIAFSWWSATYHHTQLHLYSGYLALLALLFRLCWGVVGSSTARFGSFVRGPRGIVRYLATARDWRGVGHTPLGALSVIALLALLGAQILFGLFVVNEDGDIAGPLSHLVDDQTSELARTTHMALFNVLLAFIVLHVAAIVFYRVLRGKKLLGPMLQGRSRQFPPGTMGLVAAKPGRLVACLQ